MEFKITACESPLSELLRSKMSRMYPAGSVCITPPGCVLNTRFREHVTRVKRLPVRSDDVWLVSFPKSGTTWSQEMVWLIVNNLNYKMAKERTLHERFPYFEFSCTTTPSEEGDVDDTVDYTHQLASPRCIKSHLHKQLLPDELWTINPKIIYVSRDPKDVAVSYFYHNCLMNGYLGTREEFYEAFLGDVVMFSPYWDHVLEFWRLRMKPNVLCNTYEEMKEDLPGVIRKMAKFLDKQLTETQVAELADHLSFSKMRNNPSVNFEERRETWITKKLATLPGLRFMRKGEAGAWREDMSVEMAERFDVWSRQKLIDTGFPYPSGKKT